MFKNDLKFRSIDADQIIKPMISKLKCDKLDIIIINNDRFIPNLYLTLLYYSLFTNKINYCHEFIFKVLKI